MRCPCLTGNYMFSCSARSEVYIPTSFEYAEYCNAERRNLYKVCPWYVSSPRNIGMVQPDALKLSGDDDRAARSGPRSSQMRDAA